jgi:hypothetical protein
MTNTVVDQSKNPNGRSSAILVERYRHAALSANVFYVLIVSDNEDVAKVANNEDIEKRSALVATKASKVRLRYDNPSTLLVTCDACGLEAIDIMQKLDRLGATSIRRSRPLMILRMEPATSSRRPGWVSHSAHPLSKRSVNWGMRVRNNQIRAIRSLTHKAVCLITSHKRV